jgi:hypothetical protein
MLVYLMTTEGKLFRKDLHVPSSDNLGVIHYYKKHYIFRKLIKGFGQRMTPTYIEVDMYDVDKDGEKD